MAAHGADAGPFTRALDPIVDWARRVSGLEVLHDWPGAADDLTGAAVLLHPLSLAATSPAMATHHLHGTEVHVDVLVTVVGAGAQETAATVSALALDALAEGTRPLAPGPVDLALWQALGRPPSPAFLLTVPVRRASERLPAPPVTARPALSLAPLRVLSGRVVAEGGLPLAAARLALADGTASTVSDRHGRFRLRLPEDLVGEAVGPLRLTVAAHGRTAELDLSPSSADAAGDVGDVLVPRSAPAPRGVPL